MNMCGTISADLPTIINNAENFDYFDTTGNTVKLGCIERFFRFLLHNFGLMDHSTVKCIQLSLLHLKGKYQELLALPGRNGDQVAYFSYNHAFYWKHKDGRDVTRKEICDLIEECNVLCSRLLSKNGVLYEHLPALNG